MTAAYQSAATNASAVSGVILVSAGIALVIAILVIVAMWRLFTKAGRPGWASIVPFYNTYTLLKKSGKTVYRHGYMTGMEHKVVLSTSTDTPPEPKWFVRAVVSLRWLKEP